MEDAKERILQILETGDNFLVASHSNPDGDAIGSTAALGFILKELGKNFRLFNRSGIPDHYDWLELPGPMASSPIGYEGFTPDWFVLLDCGDAERAGPELLGAIDLKKTINIDHHLGNPLYGAVNWVETGYAAVGEMAAELADDLSIPLSGPMGEAVYLALVSDTGNFSYGNTRPATMELAARILRMGLDAGDFAEKYQNQWSPNRLWLWSEVLGDARLHYGGRIASMRVSLESLRSTDTTHQDCDGLVELLRKVKGVRAAMVLRREGPDLVKFSLRSHGRDNVQQIARRFGGGGHRNAAGGTIKGDLESAERDLVATAAASLGFDLEENDQPLRYERKNRST